GPVLASVVTCDGFVADDVVHITIRAAGGCAALVLPVEARHCLTSTPAREVCVGERVVLEFDVSAVLRLTPQEARAVGVVDAGDLFLVPHHSLVSAPRRPDASPFFWPIAKEEGRRVS